MIRNFLKWIRGFCPHITLLQKPVFVIDNRILGFKPPVWGASIILTVLFFTISIQPITLYGKYVRDTHHFQAISVKNFEYIYDLSFDVNELSKYASNYDLIYRFDYYSDGFRVPATIYHRFYVNDRYVQDASFGFDKLWGGGGLGDSPIQVPSNYLVNGVNNATVHLRINFEETPSDPSQFLNLEVGYLTRSTINNIFRILSYLILPVTYFWSLYHRDMNLKTEIIEFGLVKNAISSGSIWNPKKIMGKFVDIAKSLTPLYLIFYLAIGGILLYYSINSSLYQFSGEYPYYVSTSEGNCMGSEEYIVNFNANPLTKHLSRFWITDFSRFHENQRHGSEGDITYKLSCNGVEFWTEPEIFDGLPTQLKRYGVTIPNELVKYGQNEVKMKITIDTKLNSETEGMYRIFYYSNSELKVDNTIISITTVLMLLLPTLTGLQQFRLFSDKK